MAASQFALEAAIAELAGTDPTIRDQLRSQLSMIAGLRQQVGSAQGPALGALKAEVAAVASTATAAAQDARSTASASGTSSPDVAILARAARDQVNNVMAGMKDFDPFLQFGPGDTEAAYRQREAERQAYIAAQQAKHTPEGDLNAAGGAVGQLVDAKAHGAGNSPEFQKRADDLIAATEKLRAQMLREGGSTKEFDAHLRADVRATLKAKGLSDADIDAQFAAHHDDPLQTAKAFLKSDDDLQNLRKAAEYAKHEDREELTSSDTPQQPAQNKHDGGVEPPIATGGLDDVRSCLKSAGVKGDANAIAAEDAHHGVSACAITPIADIVRV